jgi:hypothetical protein
MDDNGFHGLAFRPISGTAMMEALFRWIREGRSPVAAVPDYPAERTMKASQRWFQLQLVQTSTT